MDRYISKSVYAMCPCFFGCAECLSCSWRAVSFPASGLILRALRLCFDNSFRGANMCSITARTHTNTVRKTRESQRRSVLLNFMPSLLPKLYCLAPGAGLGMDAVLILSGLYLLLSRLYLSLLYSESPASLLLPPSSCPFLFIAFLPHPSLLHLLCSCGVLATSLSQLSITGSPLLLRLSDCVVIAPMHFTRLRIVTFYCLPLCHLSASSKINYPSNKMITAEPRATLFASYRTELFATTVIANGTTAGKERGRRCRSC